MSKPEPFQSFFDTLPALREAMDKAAETFKQQTADPDPGDRK